MGNRLVLWSGGGRFIASKDVASAAIVNRQEGHQTTYSHIASNWILKGTEYGAFSSNFSYSKTLKLNDLIYQGFSFFSGKNIIFSGGAPSFGNTSYGYLAAEWIDLGGIKYYSLFTQTFSPSDAFRINNLKIANQSWEYYQDAFRGGNSSGQQLFNYNLSNSNSSGTEYQGHSNSFNCPVPAVLVDLVSFRGAWTGGGVVLLNNTYVPSYPFSGYGYNAIRLLGNNGVFYIQLVGQWVSSFSVNVFTLSSNGFIYYQGSWNQNAYAGTIRNPPAGLFDPYKGKIINPSIGGWAIAITYADGTKVDIPVSYQPTWVQVKPANSCPDGTVLQCDCGGATVCCYGCVNGRLTLIDSFNKTQ